MALLGLITLVSFTAHAQFWKKQNQALLPEDQAFTASVSLENNSLLIRWEIADEYYMYRDQFQVVSNTPGLKLGAAQYPQGVIENDPEFGKVVVYFNAVEYSVPFDISSNLFVNGSDLKLELKGQGCNKTVGVCYPPQNRSISLTNVTFSSDQQKKSALNPNVSIEKALPDRSSTQQSSTGDTAKSFWGYVITALGAGILLSFTPCVLPMIPILAGVIAGQSNPSKLRSGWLAICYVAGTIITYAIAGWVAGASGTQLQAYFQSPWFIGIICGFLVILAASLFGLFKIQLSSSVQTTLNSASFNSRSASVSSLALGLISALIVGACVSPILIITLGAAITQGDPILGAAIMSAMALGMGSLLIVFGFGAGWLLPKTGAWMNQIQILFGFMVLGVTIFIASAIPSVPSLYLWAALLFWCGSFLLRFAYELQTNLTASLIFGAGIAALLWASMALIGANTGGNDILKPLSSVALSNKQSKQTVAKLPFAVVTSAGEAKQQLETAKANGQPALVDFYADWCLDCKRMDKTTFLQASVHEALRGWVLIKVDVTTTNEDSEAAKKHFEIFGPPATLFFSPDGNEQLNLRQYGYLSETEFLTLIAQIKR